mmetsp:Transcript_4853/g.14647  ORF Transcript_4853/g.14647 Transcript_4853/m.14647 type:complete len:243 (-) Transcript_4853:978-1706(-)
MVVRSREMSSFAFVASPSWNLASSPFISCSLSTSRARFAPRTCSAPQCFAKQTTAVIHPVSVLWSILGTSNTSSVVSSARSDESAGTGRPHSTLCTWSVPGPSRHLRRSMRLNARLSLATRGLFTICNAVRSSFCCSLMWLKSSRAEASFETKFARAQVCSGNVSKRDSTRLLGAQPRAFRLTGHMSILHAILTRLTASCSTESNSTAPREMNCSTSPRTSDRLGLTVRLTSKRSPSRLASS